MNIDCRKKLKVFWMSIFTFKQKEIHIENLNMDQILTVSTSTYDGVLRIRFLSKDPQFEKLSLLKDEAEELTKLMPLRKCTFFLGSP